MSTQHMPGRIKVQHPHAGLRGFELADEKTGLHQVCQDVTEGNAHRLAACWNACEGIETYALELMVGDLSIHSQLRRQRQGKLTPKATAYRKQRDELLEALKVVLRDHMAVHGVGDLEMQPALFQASAAIAKATGEQTCKSLT